MDETSQRYQREELTERKQHLRKEEIENDSDHWPQVLKVRRLDLEHARRLS